MAYSAALRRQMSLCPGCGYRMRFFVFVMPDGCEIWHCRRNHRYECSPTRPLPVLVMRHEVRKLALNRLELA